MQKVIRAGVGLDIGTTTVQAQLVDLDSGEILELVSALNDQRVFGADVITRIACAREGKTHELFTSINRQVEKILRQFIDKWNLSKIDKCAVSGNTTMLHFFANIDPSPMGEAPYTPAFLDERQFKGSELSLSAECITLLPGISAFVGADIAAGLAFLDVIGRQGNALFVDIGTNGEIAVWKGKERRLLCTSTAAGPCFERESITYGSDLIDAIYAMKTLGVIDKSGAMVTEYADDGFFSVPQQITVTQADVRRFQLAKSAIYSGISVLCRTAGIEPGAFGAVYIAGGMGFYINLENAAETGLLPRGIIAKSSHQRCEVCGNTSLKGAVQSLTDQSFLQRCEGIIAQANVIDLAVDKEFADMFVENMGF